MRFARLQCKQMETMLIMQYRVGSPLLGIVQVEKTGKRGGGSQVETSIPTVTYGRLPYKQALVH